MPNKELANRRGMVYACMRYPISVSRTVLVRISGPTLVRVTDRLVMSAKVWTLRYRLEVRLDTSILS